MKSINPTDAAELAGLTEDDLRDLAKRGHLTSWKGLDGGWWFDHDEINAIAAAVRRAGTEQGRRAIESNGYDYERSVLYLLLLSEGEQP